MQRRQRVLSPQPASPQRLGRDQSGAALVVVLLLTALLFALGAFGSRTAQLELLIAGNELQTRRALEVAQAGLDHALSLLRKVDAAGRNEGADGFDDELGGGGTGGALVAIGGTAVVDGATYRFRHFGGLATDDGYYVRAFDDYDETAGFDDPAKDANFRIHLVSLGRVGRAERFVHAIVERDPAFACALCGADDPLVPATVVEMTGALQVDSFDSRDGPYDPLAPGAKGDVLSNGDVDMTADLLGLLPIDVRGDVTAKGTIAQTGVVNVTGTVTQVPQPIAFPPVSPCGPPYPPNDGLSGGAYDRALGTLANVGANEIIDLAPGDYCFSAITMTGGSTLRANGPVRLLLTAPSTILGIVNTTGVAADLRIYSSVVSPAAPPIVPGLSITGAAQASAAIYAPGAIVTFTGLSDFYGSVIAANLPNIGIAGVHYDEALENPGIRIASWSEERSGLPD